MDYRYDSEQKAFQKKFGAWVDANLPEHFDANKRHNFETKEELISAYRIFQKKLFDAGYAGMHISKEYGGQGKTVKEEAIVLQTLSDKCIELRHVGAISTSMAAPTILSAGTEAQKKEFIPKILDGTHIWCQGFSEPDAGSDVANISTQAVRKDDHYIMNGQKVWTSIAHLADYCMMLVRTDPAAPKHKGISYLLVDMALPGIEIRPLPQITGEPEFNEVFLKDVKVPADRLLGEENKGWMLVITTLMFERVLGDVVMGSTYEKMILKILETAKKTKRSGKAMIDDPVLRQKIGRSYAEIMALKYHGLRNFSQQLSGKIPGPEGSIGKLLWSEPGQRVAEMALDMLGPYSQIPEGTPWSVDNGDWQYHYSRSKGNTIEAGSSEIQRTIIGERVLGLPKDGVRAKKA